MNEEDQLKHHREMLLRLFVARLRDLRFPKVPPESYYVGQEYVEDVRRPQCTLITSVLQPAKFDPFNFWHKGAKVSVFQNGSRLFIKVDRKIPQRLFDDMRLLGIRHEYIVSYMTQYIPIINRNLLDAKYTSSNFLLKTFSVYDLMDIVVLSDKKAVRCPWPFQFQNFPMKTNLTPFDSHVYVRDYIDACTLYFEGNYDECIRKIITSVENFIHEKQWILPKETLFSRIKNFLMRKKISSNRRSFRKILNHYIPTDEYRGKTVNFNIQHIYSVRNKIVHDGFRTPIRADMFCDKAVSTLHYFLFLACGDGELRKLLSGSRMHFVMMQREGKGMLNLDEIERREKRKKEFVGKPIETDTEFDRHMFSALQFNQSDLRSVC